MQIEMLMENLASTSTFLSNYLVAMEYFKNPIQLQDAINCLNRLGVKGTCHGRPLSEFCSIHPQMKLDLFCKQCSVEVCRECVITGHVNHEHTASSEKIHEETRRLGVATAKMVELLEEMKQAISGVKEMRQRVSDRKDNSINQTKEVFAALHKAVDEKEEQTIADIKNAAHEREKTLEVLY